MKIKNPVTEMEAGTNYVLECVSDGSNPVANITWTLGSSIIKSSYKVDIMKDSINDKHLQIIFETIDFFI